MTARRGWLSALFLGSRLTGLQCISAMKAFMRPAVSLSRSPRTAPAAVTPPGAKPILWSGWLAGGTLSAAMWALAIALICR